MFGDTHLLATMNPVFINGNGWLDNNMYQLTFNDQVSDIFHNQLLIGAFGQMDYISKITMAFLDHDYNIIRNEDHDPMEFLGYEHPLGHFFDLITMTLPYSYIRFLFHPKGNERFDPNKVYVHSGNKTGPKPEDENQRNGSLPIEVDEEELTALNNDTVAIDNMINETLSTIEGSDELAHLDQCLAAAAAAARPTIGRGRRQQSSVNCSLVNSQMGFGK